LWHAFGPVTALFSVCIVISLALDAAVVFSPERVRRKIAVALMAVLLLTWVFLAVALLQIAWRTESPLIPAAGIRRPDLVQSAGHEVLVVLASLGGPALLATFLGGAALRTSRRRRPRPGHMERMK
jgi:hypothetical protein